MELDQEVLLLSGCKSTGSLNARYSSSPQYARFMCTSGRSSSSLSAKTRENRASQAEKIATSEWG